MGCHTLETMEKSYDSQRDALRRLLEVCPRVEISGSGHTILDPLRGEVRPSWGIDHKTLIPHATVVAVDHKELFDYGRPRIIGERYWEWTSFLKTRFYIDVPWTAYFQEPSQADENGKIINPAHLRETKCQIRLRCELRDVGLKGWHDNYAHTLQLFDGAPGELVAQYRRAVVQANEHVTKWQAAIRKVSEVSV